LRATRKERKRNQWNKTAQRKNDLLKKLAEAEQKHEFYSRLYKRYTVDLLRLAIYARALAVGQGDPHGRPLAVVHVRAGLEPPHQRANTPFEPVAGAIVGLPSGLGGDLRGGVGRVVGRPRRGAGPT